ncbi:MAG: nucleotide exchange factor GrpE [Woeseiaceae bacterium]
MNGESDRPEDDGEQLQETTNSVNPEDAETSAETASGEPNLEEIQARADENWDRYLRAAAETENVRKRAARDVEHARKYALEAFAKEMLAVRDTFEMGLDAADSADVASLTEGNKATLKLLIATLERFGISEVDPQGEPFDPELHEAISMQPSAEAEPGSVLIVAQKGYALNGRLLRPAMVVVAAEAKDEQESA